MMKNKKKIAVISELALHNVNYGNRLQAYALNDFLSKNYHFFRVDSLILKDFRRFKQFKYTKICVVLFEKIFKKAINKSIGENTYQNHEG